jgi:hypothetical protein
MSYLLINKHLEVVIGAPTEFYKGSRFDASGNVVQVTLNQKHTFCTNEKKEHHNGFGFGLVNEFDIEQPYSYLKAKPGEWFHKIGVGELQKTDNEPYQFFKPYHKKELYYHVSQIGAEELVFQTESNNLKGVKYLYAKTITIFENQLWIKYQLKNIGTIAFETTEYCHNFLAINQRNLDASYALKLNSTICPNEFTANVNTHQLLNMGKNEITWKATPENDFFIENLTGTQQTCTGWQLQNTDEKAAVSEVVDFECTQMNLWGTTHVVSPELFFKTNILPKHEAVWRRKFTFYDLQ